MAEQKKAPKKVPNHPPASSMVASAIGDLKERNGSSLQAIKKYIAANFNVDIDRQTPFIKRALKDGVTKGTFVQTKGKGASGSFKLNPKSAKDDAAAKKAKKEKERAKLAAKKEKEKAKAAAKKEKEKKAAAAKKAKAAAKKKPAKKATDKKKTPKKKPAAKPKSKSKATPKKAAKKPAVKKTKTASKTKKPAAKKKATKKA